MRVIRRNQLAQRPLAIQKRPGAEINAIQPEEIERIVTWLASMSHEIVEVRAAFLIQHHNLAIQDRTLPFQAAQNLPCGEDCGGVSWRNGWRIASFQFAPWRA
jgi:hypothetical protein